MSKKQGETVKITLVKPGALRVGEYNAGVIYEVSTDEAEKLVKKGFEIIQNDKTIGE